MGRIPVRGRRRHGARKAAGGRYGAVIVTNQRGLALGIVGREDLEDIHVRMRARLATAGVRIDDIYVCPHDVDTCECRKPGTGLFLQAQRDHPWISFPESDLVGDSISDLEAGRRLAMRLWLVGTQGARRSILQEAAGQGLQVAGSGSSLMNLIESGGLLASAGRAGGNAAGSAMADGAA